MTKKQRRREQVRRLRRILKLTDGITSVGRGIHRYNYRGGISAGELFRPNVDIY